MFLAQPSQKGKNQYGQSPQTDAFITLKELFSHYTMSYRKMFDFKGRANRTQYWSCFLLNVFIFFLYFCLQNLLLVLAIILSPWLRLWMVGFTIFCTLILLFFLFLWALSLLIPHIALSIRRLHDTGRSGWWVLAIYMPSLLYGLARACQIYLYGAKFFIWDYPFALLPFLAYLPLYFFLAQPSQKGKNPYGDHF